MMVGMTEKPATSSSFSERVKNTLGNFFPFNMGTVTGDEAETQEEEEDDDGQDDFGSQVSLNSSTQENGAYTDRETGTMDQFGEVRTISNTTKGSGQSGDFVNITNSEMQTGQSRSTGLSNAPADPELDTEKTTRPGIKARISTSYLGSTPLVKTGASIEEALTNVVGSIGEQNEQMSKRLSEMEKAVHVERESLREEINRNKQEASRSEKHLRETTDENLAKNLPRLTREAEQREIRLRYDISFNPEGSRKRQYTLFSLYKQHNSIGKRIRKSIG